MRRTNGNGDCNGNTYNHLLGDAQIHSRWPALAALLAVGGLYSALPERLSIGPYWLLSAIVSVLAVPIIITHRSGRHDWSRWLGYIGLTLETMALTASVTLLVLSLPSHKFESVVLLRAAGALWLTNVLVFASWYWKLDAGGPYYRELRNCHKRGAFLFPQMTLDDNDPNCRNDWRPHFFDYLFLAFNTSTALSPTDTAVLAHWAKILMMIQSLISLTIIAVLASRAVNIL